jgi:hypothetical protein
MRLSYYVTSHELCVTVKFESQTASEYPCALPTGLDLAWMILCAKAIFFHWPEHCPCAQEQSSPQISYGTLANLISLRFHLQAQAVAFDNNGFHHRTTPKITTSTVHGGSLHWHAFLL